MKKAYQVVSFEIIGKEGNGDEWTMYEGFDLNAARAACEKEKNYHSKRYGVEIRVINVPDSFSFADDDAFDVIAEAGWDVI